MFNGKLLLLSYGNPGRGDDGLGPQLLKLLQGCDQDFSKSNICYITDFQLQIEHVLDIDQYDMVLMMDADCSNVKQFDFYPVEAKFDDSHHTHHLTPCGLLNIYQQVFKKTPPPSFLLTMHGKSFRLGHHFSQVARQNLVLAFVFCYALCSLPDPLVWQQYLVKVPNV